MSNETKAAVTGPDGLLVEIGRSVMPKAIAISVAVHVVLAVLTSFSLFADWADWGFHAPATINQMKAKAAREAEEEKRKADAEEKARKAAAEAAAAAKTNAAAKASAPAAKDASAAKDAPAAKDAKAVTPPEVKPLPPKSNFEYGEDLSLD